jgi:hypothetical protein
MSSVIHEQRDRTVPAASSLSRASSFEPWLRDHHENERFESSSQWCLMNSSCSSLVATDSNVFRGTNVPTRSFPKQVGQVCVRSSSKHQHHVASQLERRLAALPNRESTVECDILGRRSECNSIFNRQPPRYRSRRAILLGSLADSQNDLGFTRDGEAEMVDPMCAGNDATTEHLLTKVDPWATGATFASLRFGPSLAPTEASNTFTSLARPVGNKIASKAH